MCNENEKLKELYTTAKQIATKAHHGQVDKGGYQYINHPITVANSFETIKHKIVALLHDVLEDSEITSDTLKSYGFPEQIINSIGILTKGEDVSYERYLSLVKADDIATAVKKADLKHNMDISRIPNPTEKDLSRIEKYKKALCFLES